MSDVDVDTIRVLHVDDDPEIVDLAARFLQREDDRIEVFPAVSAGEALDLLVEEALDCVISDYQLPDMDCATFVAEIHERDPDVPILLFTGRDRAQLDDGLLDSDIHAYLQKGSGTEQYGELADEILGALAQRDGYATDGGVRTDGGADRRATFVESDFFTDLAPADKQAVLTDALEAVPDGYLVLDTTGSFVYWNEAVSTVTGYDDVADVAPADLFVDADRDAVEGAIETAAETGTAAVDATVATPDGDEVPVAVHCTRLTTADGEVAGTAVVLQYDDGPSGYAAELDRQAERLEEVVGSVSHDLRNPLNVMTGRLQLAREMGDEEHFDALERATDRMERLLDDLVQLAREGKTVEETETVALADRCVVAWEDLDTADATLSVETERTVEAEKYRLRQVLEDLFRNAVEHGSTDTQNSESSGDAVEHGGSSVTVTVGDLEDGFYVEDDGPGIAPDKRERLLEYGESTGQDGTGLGLALARRIAEAHGWTMTLTEGAAGGLRVEFTGLAGELPPSPDPAEE
jgi:PAS domain S-box-containing protein